MTDIDQYIHAAMRDNTRQSYQSAVRHFEVEWGGFLPATADSVARYLAHYAELLSINTLKQRLAALAQWHINQGFPDPTKAPIVRKVLRGIQTLHPAQKKQAKPLQLLELEQTVNALEKKIISAKLQCDRPSLLRHTRNKSMLLLGFWRGFRGDELLRLQIEDIDVVPGAGMTCFLPYSKGDRHYKGGSFKAPALSRLCPVNAYIDWTELAALKTGAVFRGVDRWGKVSESALNIDSLTPLLRAILKDAHVESAALYSGHSLRRGFANWAAANGWDVRALMEHIGWKNVNSALRYIDNDDSFSQKRIEIALSTYVDTKKTFSI